MGFFLCAASLGAAAAAPAGRVQFPSLDEPGAEAVLLSAWWFPAAQAVSPLSASTAPAIVLLHGCGGMLNRKGEPTARIRDYTALLNRQGWHVLAVDSLSPRGEKELCTQRIGTRKVTQVQRRRDALGALQWLAVQPGVDARRLALLGWSNGGSTALAATNGAQREVAASAVHPRLTVAFYPGCEAELARGFQPVADTLLLLGLADDWTPAAPCQALAGKRAGHTVRVQAYEGAYHGFDGQAPVVLRRDVPNGVHPGQGVHVGGEPQAREQSRQMLLQALQQAFAR